MDLSALFGYEQDLASAWVERVCLLALLAPWFLTLSEVYGAGSRRGGAIALILLLLIDRLRWDPRLWAAIACVLLGAWNGIRARWVSSPPGSPTAGLVAPAIWMLVGGLCAGAVSWSHSVGWLLWPALAFASFAMGAALAPLGRPPISSVVLAGLCGGLLAMASQGLSRSNLPLLLAAGVIGWLGLQFLWWRQTRHSKGSAPGRWKSALAGVMAGLLAAAVGVEVYFRHVYDCSDANGELRTCVRHLQKHGRFNTLGYRDREFPDPAHLPPGPRVVLLGDSFAFGIGINAYEDLLGPQLQKSLRQTGLDGAEVYTVARGGVDTTREIELFRRDAVPLAPHAVVLAYHLNDIEDRQFARPHDRAALVLSPLTASSDAFEFLEWRVYSLLHAGDLRGPLDAGLGRYADEKVFASQARRVQELITLIRHRGARPVCVIYPYLNMPTDAGPHRHAIDRMARLFADLRVPAIDVSRLVNVNERRYHANRFDPHPSPQLNRVVAAALAGQVAGVLRAPASSQVSGERRN